MTQRLQLSGCSGQTLMWGMSYFILIRVTLSLSLKGSTLKFGAKVQLFFESEAFWPQILLCSLKYWYSIQDLNITLKVNSDRDVRSEFIVRRCPIISLNDSQDALLLLMYIYPLSTAIGWSFTMGHSSSLVTEKVYAEFRQEVKAEAVAKLNFVF